MDFPAPGDILLIQMCCKLCSLPALMRNGPDRATRIAELAYIFCTVKLALKADQTDFN